MTNPRLVHVAGTFHGCPFWGSAACQSMVLHSDLAAVTASRSRAHLTAVTASCSRAQLTAVTASCSRAQLRSTGSWPWDLRVSAAPIMIKIIFYVDIVFFYRRQIFYVVRRWSYILQRSDGNKGLCHSCRSHWFGWKLALLHAALSSCDIKISVVSQCSILVAVQYMNTQLFAFFFQVFD